jgi:hypothetical protein
MALKFNSFQGLQNIVSACKKKMHFLGVVEQQNVSIGDFEKMPLTCTPHCI